MRLIVIPTFLLGFWSLCESNVLPESDLICRPGTKCYQDKIKDRQASVKKIGDRVIDVECQAGTEWTSNCHRCNCSESGLAYCQLENTSCVGNDGRNLDPVRCKPGSTFNRNCNNCTCGDNGLSTCTIMKCNEMNQEVAIPSTSPAPVTNSLDNKTDEVATPLPLCAAGTKWLSQCNNCECSQDGQPKCDINLCEGSTEPFRSCKPGSRWEGRCSKCWCSDAGLPFCTRDGCQIVQNIHFDDDVSTEVETQKPNNQNSGPNIVNEGQTVVQTAYPGTEAVSNRPDHEKDKVATPPRLCEAGTSWLSQCNNCECSQDGQPKCEINLCMDSTEPFRSCKPGSRWEDRCSKCWCSDAGLPFCTRNGCHTVYNIHFDYDESTEVETVKPNNQNSGPNVENEGQTGVQTDYPGTEDIHFDNDESTEVVTVKPNNQNSGPNAVNEGQTEDQTNKPGSKGQKNGIPYFNNGEETIYADRRYIDHTRSHNEETSNRKHNRDTLENKMSLGKQQTDNDDTNDIDHNIVRRSVCKQNQNFKQDCNVCECASDGLSFKCTQNECMEKGEVDKEVEVFMESEGIDHIERHSVCRALGVFYIGCNTCHCNFDGSDYTCTNKPCPLPEDVELFHELRERRSSENKTSKPKIVCVANRMFIKDCNTCWCNEDGTSFTCTRKVCVQDLPDDAEVDEESTQDLRIIKESCRPDEVFESDCNLCYCNKDGNSYSCTKKACLTELTEAAEVHHVDRGQEDLKYGPQRHPIRTESEPMSFSLIGHRFRRAATQPEPPKSCKPDSEFRLDCNTCLCDNLGKNFSCTRNDCSKPNGVNPTPRKEERKKREIKEQEATCTPGSVFEQGCSVCRCDSDGKHATCNVRACIIKNNDQQEQNNTTNAVTSESNFRCNPGEQFKRDCNDCTCSADGKSVFCTLRFCDVVESSSNV